MSELVCTNKTDINKINPQKSKRVRCFDSDNFEWLSSGSSKYRWLKNQRDNTVPKIKTEEEKERDSKMIHKIASHLLQKYYTFTTCIQSSVDDENEFQIEEYQISKGKQYEILAVDYRLDNNYILMREFNNDTELLFGGDLKKAKYRNVKSKNYFEYVRRGYCDCREMFLYHKEIEEENRIAKLKKKEEMKKNFFYKVFKTFCGKKDEEENEIKEKMEKKTIQELKKELVEGVIEISISDFCQYFSEPIFEKSEHIIRKQRKTFDISGKYTSIKMKYKGVLKIQIQKPIRFSGTIWIFNASGRSLKFKQTVSENTTIDLMIPEFVSFNNHTNYVTVAIGLTPEYETKQGLTVEIEVENDEYFEFDDVTNKVDHMIFKIPNNNGLTERCLFCNDKCDGMEEILFIKGEIFHHSCYHYRRCCYCYNKPLHLRMMFIPHLKGFICSQCFPDIFNFLDLERRGHL